MDKNQVEQIDKILAPYFSTLGNKISDLEIKVDVPQPKVTVNVPEVKVPKIELPTINVPEIKIPQIVLPEINVPQPKVTVNVDEVSVKNWPEKVSLKKIEELLEKIEKKKFGSSGYSYSGPQTYKSGEIYDTTMGVAGVAAMWEDTGRTMRTVSASKPLPVNVVDGDITLNVGDVQIGAVELKDGTTDDRAPISATDGLLVNLGTNNDVTVTGTVTAGTELPDAILAADGLSNPTAPQVLGNNYIYDSFNGQWNRQKATLNSYIAGGGIDGEGIAAAGLMAQYDNTSPGTVTENKFAPLRMSDQRELFAVLKSNAGTGYGLTISSGGAALVDGSATTQPVSATNLDIRDLTHVSDSVKIGDGTDTATVATALDSRNGLDTQASSIASKNIVDFVSTSGALSAGGEKIFSPGGTRATYYDLDGYEGLYFSFTDNSPGASGGTMYFRWSRDGSNTAYNDPGDGTGFTNYDGISTATLVGALFIPKKNRYVNFVFVQGGSNQGSSYPQLALMDITAYPYGFFTSAVSITNSAIPVYGPTDVATYGQLPVMIGGVNSVSSPVTAIPVLASATGELSVQGTRTTYTGTPLVTVQKLVTTSTQSAVTAGTTSSTLVASSTSRVGVIAYNAGQYPVHFRLSSSACTTATGGYSGIIWPGCSAQIGTIYKPYSGAVTCITPSGTGNSSIALSTI